MTRSGWARRAIRGENFRAKPDDSGKQAQHEIRAHPPKGNQAKSKGTPVPEPMKAYEDRTELWADPLQGLFIFRFQATLGA